MIYKENPKTQGIPSEIISCIPQPGSYKNGICANKCKDCFFQDGRSYLEPLKENLPNMPKKVKPWQVVRVVDSYSKIEGEKGTSACRFCGTCLKHYMTAMEKNDYNSI